jgi:NOL1/NOP2/fmu family ribosome biogenesis protein
MLKIFNKKEKTQFEHQLNEQFGIEQVNGTLLQFGPERIFLFQGNLNNRQLQELEELVPIERIGVYLAKVVPGEGKIRLSIEGTHILKPQITKNIFELPENLVDNWMKGQDLQLALNHNEFLVMKYKDDLLGTGKSSQLGNKISNFIPKTRRLREKGN